MDWQEGTCDGAAGSTRGACGTGVFVASGGSGAWGTDPTLTATLTDYAVWVSLKVSTITRTSHSDTQ